MCTTNPTRRSSVLTRRQAVVRLGLIAAAPVAANLLPTCKACGDRILLRLLSDDYDGYCYSCRPRGWVTGYSPDDMNALLKKMYADMRTNLFPIQTPLLATLKGSTYPQWAGGQMHYWDVKLTRG